MYAIRSYYVAAATGIGWLYFRANPEAWEAFLAEMEGEPAAVAPARRTQAPRPGDGLAASGNIEAEQVTIAAQSGGRVVEILAAEGEWVEAGAVLLRLDDTDWRTRLEGAEASLNQALAAEDAARAQLALAEVV